MVTWAGEGWKKRVDRRSRISLSWLEYVGSGPLKGCFVGIFFSFLFFFFARLEGGGILLVKEGHSGILVVSFIVVSSIKRKRFGGQKTSGHVSFRV